jgi:hypothetical protein
MGVGGALVVSTRARIRRRPASSRPGGPRSAASAFGPEPAASFSYDLFGVSNADLKRIEALQRAYFRELRNIAALSEPVEHIAEVNLQLFSLLGEIPAKEG